MSSVDLPRFALEIRPDRSRVVLGLTGEIDIANVIERARREGWGLAVTKGSQALERILTLACLSSSLRRA